MFSVILSFVVLVVLGVVLPAAFGEKANTYGSKLEEYIVSRNPKDTYDVEKLTREFDEKQKQGII